MTIMRFEGVRGTELRTVRLHGAQRDPLRARQRLERALGVVDWTPPHLPPRAVLLVRRLVVGSHSDKAFGAGVTKALRRRADVARRPWLHADAAGAEAVIFADEAEMIACLIRDWLRGLVSARWWWRAVLQSASAEQWVRQHVLPRGDMLVPVVSLLEPRKEVVPWFSRMPDPDVRVAVAAVARAFALSASERSTDRAQMEIANSGTASVSRIGSPAVVRTEIVDATQRLIAIVPEVRASTLGHEQRRLVAVVMAVLRAPSWARSIEFANTLAALDRITAEHAPRAIRPDEVAREDTPQSRNEDPAPMAVVPHRTTGAHSPSPTDPTEAAGGIAQTSTGTAQRASSRNRTREVVSDSIPPAPAPEREPLSGTSDELRHPPSRHDVVAVVPAAPSGAEPVATESDWAQSDPHGEADAAPDPLAGRIETQYGGIFYLLNAWLAMGLYGDFTAPRARNLALSPWNLLALVGRAWFGKPFAGDPIWHVLADLAVRDPDDEPDRDRVLPDGWLDGHLDTLTARLQAALGCDVRGLPEMVCRHHARIEITAAAVHVHLVLCDLPLDLRIAGLDRDPGWIPAAGRAVSFHFD
jgi:hypothetical protein